MARVILTLSFKDGDSAQAVVDAKSSYPDALATMRREAGLGLREVIDALCGEVTADVSAEIDAALEDEG